MNTQEKLKSQVGHWWHNFTQGWEDLSHKAGAAMTKFLPHRQESGVGQDVSALGSGWSVLAVEMIDKQDKLIIELEVPGLEKKDLDVEVAEDRVNVSGHKYASQDRKEGKTHIVERAYGRFHRSIPLPCAVDGSRSSASYKRGVLSITIPKEKHSEVDDKQVVIQ